MTEVTAARADLEGALEFAREVGSTVPCLGPEGPFWTSDDVDEQAVAALACGDCPLPMQCAAYARLTHASAGVWGDRIHGGSARALRDVKGLRSTVLPKGTKKRPDGGLLWRCGCLGRTRGGGIAPAMTRFTWCDWSTAFVVVGCRSSARLSRCRTARGFGPSSCIGSGWCSDVANCVAFSALFSWFLGRKHPVKCAIES
ncbi:hypothetical protein CHE218_30890 [Microbacterium sp. che218]